ncbi:MAG: hypothetical protein JXA42_12645 [Anaerolineales bacterium]|nr:hypothetical protein [Anaerolineales bacterium]
MLNEKHVLFLFLDGVGLGDPDPERNPFCRASMPVLEGLLGNGWYLLRQDRIPSEYASLAVTDACLDVPGRPQSATGQAALLTGRNVPAELGMHYGPKPNKDIAGIIKTGNIFTKVKNAGGNAIFLNPYPPRFFELLDNGRRLASANQLAARTAGVNLRTHQDLLAGQAISPDFTGLGWRDRLGFPDTPVLSFSQAGRQMARLAQAHSFSFFDYWPTDHSGHRQNFTEAVRLLENLDQVLGGLLDGWDWKRGIILITSDHGNVEDLGIKNHTLKPVPTIVIGRDHRRITGGIQSLVDVEPALTRYLEISNGSKD